MARTSKKKIKLSEMSGQDDPRAPLDSAALLAAATPLLKRLEADLRARVTASPAVQRALEARWEKVKKEERTAESFAAWSAALATQVAAAWLLSCVFVRTLEDRGLLRQARLAGTGALDSQKLFFQLAPSLTERDYLLTVFRELSRHPAARELFDAEHSLVWKLSPSAELAKELLALFRTPNAEAPTFRFGQVSTRFLGDLYQDLSEDVRKRYALLQTPDFIESFILDRTLEPAIERFGLDDTTLIDPTCGSGHFLLGAFDRLFEHRLKKEPGVDVRVAAQSALDAVYGADINPYAVATARFRLTLAYLEKAGYGKLADAPALPLHVVVADSLLHNSHQPQEMASLAGQSAAAWGGDAFALEDEVAARAVLHRQYAAVVGNPPYITEKDPKRREVYRRMYVSAAGKYALSAPFCERFFQLARERGYVGQITANSFMKREFGKQLIESYLPNVNLELIVNTSGAYVPGHGTPTVLLFGTHEPQSGNEVLAVLANRGEPSTPEDPARGEVWSSISGHWSEVGFENDYISIARMDVAGLRQHPWSLGGGGAAELKALLEDRCNATLGDMATAVGFDAILGEDDIFAGAADWIRRLGASPEHRRALVEGECIRDWVIESSADVIFPYDVELSPDIPAESALLRDHFWRYRTALAGRRQFGKTTIEAGLAWFEYRSFYKAKRKMQLSIAFAFVATHNHFVLDRGGRVFKQTAPIIKLPEGTNEDDHLTLLAYLNSSTACFWMKQVMFNKGATSDRGVLQADEDKFRYEFDGTKMQTVPLPAFRHRERLRELARELLVLAASVRDGDYLAVMQSCAAQELGDRWQRVDGAHASAEGRMVAAQEDIDWLIYDEFGLLDEPGSLNSIGDSRPGAYASEDRPFARAENVLSGLDDRRLAINMSPALTLLEVAEYKRRWYRSQGKFNASEVGVASRRAAAVETYALDLSEACAAANVDAMALPALKATCGRQLEMLKAGLVELGLLDLDAWSFLAARVVEAAVPFSAAWRYSEDGLSKFLQWSHCWDAQRAEDAGGKPPVAVPLKYGPDDFQNTNLFRLRGKLDVPKERFISYPGCESDEDGEPVYGWAGWNHLQRAQALASLYMKRKDGEAWAKERLTPMLAGLLELIPWVKQWHSEPSEEFQGLRMGDYFEQFLDGECRQLGLSHDDLLAWRPAKKTRGKAAKPKKVAPSTPETASASDAPASDAPDKKPAARARKKKAPAAVEASTIGKPEDAPGDPSA